MKAKIKITFLLIVSLSFGTSKLVLSQENEPPLLIETIKSEDPENQFFHCYDQIRRDPKITEDKKVQLKIRLLLIIHQFLKTHERPQGTTYMNMRPPDGGMSGVAPESVKDPAKRAKYQKMLDDNNALGEAQMKHDTLSRMQKDIAEYFAVFIQIKPENLRMVSEEINKNSKKPESGKEMMDLIDRASTEKLKKVPLWPQAEIK